MQTVAEHWREHGFDLDLTELVYFGDRNEAEAYLADHGWQLSGSSIGNCSTRTAFRRSTTRRWAAASATTATSAASLAVRE